MHDVYAYGVLAPSTLVELDGAFPDETGYGEITRTHPSLGGEAAGGAYVLARLGVATKLSGNRLGNDLDSLRVLELLTGAGVDCTAIGTDAEDPVTEIVISGNGERTVLGSYGRMLERKDWSEPSRADIESAKIVCLDPFFGDASDQAAEWCRAASIPYVTVDTPPDSAIAQHAAVVIVSEEFAARSYDSSDPETVMSTFTGRCKGLTILTRGAKPLLYSRDGAAASDFTPFGVGARDTTGAGDSFRAGIIYGMLKGYHDPELIETASAVAAMVSLQVPGVLNSPTVDELEGFLAANR
jgi:sugar/nucleoside kinase (ribokinase family)